jgi:hypothetical protein
MTQIPEVNTEALTEVVRFRCTPEVKKAVGHIAVDESASEQNTYIHLLRLGIESFERQKRDTQKSARRAQEPIVTGAR